MATRVYRASQNQRIDQICREVYGTEQDGVVDTVYAANPEILALGPVLPLGTLVMLPIIERKVREYKIIQLWD